MVRMKLRSSVERDLERLDYIIRRQLILGCKELCDDWTIGKILSGPLKGLRAHRVGTYRILYRVRASSEVDIVTIGHRREIYERVGKQKRSRK